MVRIELAEHEVLILREFLEAELHDLHHELHHTDSRKFKEQLKAKQAVIERVLGLLGKTETAHR
jgi:hypothetical protein